MLPAFASVTKLVSRAVSVVSSLFAPLNRICWPTAPWVPLSKLSRKASTSRRSCCGLFGPKLKPAPSRANRVSNSESLLKPKPLRLLFDARFQPVFSVRPRSCAVFIGCGASGSPGGLSIWLLVPVGRLWQLMQGVGPSVGWVVNTVWPFAGLPVPPVTFIVAGNEPSGLRFGFGG